MADKIDSANAAAWSMGSRVFAQASQLLVFLIAARFLSPEQFGAFSLLSAINMLMARVAAGGWSEFATSSDRDPKVDAHAFTLAAIFGLVAATLGVAAAYGLTHVETLAKYATLQLLLGISLAGIGPNAFWGGLLLRQRRGRALAQVTLVAQLAGALATILGLTQGLGLLALGAGKVVGNFIELIALLVATRTLPAPRFSSPGAPEIIRFTKNITLTKFLGYAKNESSTLLIGGYLGPEAAGFYRAGSRMAGSLAEVLTEPARVVCWMALRQAADQEVSNTTPSSSMAEDPREAPVPGPLSEGSERFITMVLIVVTPLFFGFAATSESVIVAVMGENWRNAAPVAAFLAIARWLGLLPYVVTTPLFSFIRRVEFITRLSYASTAITLLGLVAFAPFGMVSVAVGQVVAALLSSALSAWTSWRFAAVRWGRAILRGRASLVASFIMVAVLAVYRSGPTAAAETSLLHLATEIAVGIVAFLPIFTIMGGWSQFSRAYLR